MKINVNPNSVPRKRLPFMHMMTARDANVPLKDALAGFFFVMLLPHIKNNPVGNGESDAEVWSRMDDDDVCIYYLLAEIAIEQVQEWIAHGIQEPYVNPVYGNLVERPEWAKHHRFMRHTPPETLAEIEKIKSEIVGGAT